MSPVHPSGRGREAFAALARHNDPLLREIGAQLREGRMRPRDVLSARVYRTVVRRALDRVRRESGATGERP